MDREHALKLFEASKRFPSSGGRVLVRDVELAATVAAVRAERSPSSTLPRLEVEARLN